jgi:hypothetical protein
MDLMTVCWWISSMLCIRKITTTLAGKTLEGSVVRSSRAFYCPFCAAWMWMNSWRKAVTHWGMQMILLLSTVEIFCRLSWTSSGSSECGTAVVR